MSEPSRPSSLKNVPNTVNVPIIEVTQIEGHPQRPNNEEAGPIRVTAGLADSSTGKCLWPPQRGTR